MLQLGRFVCRVGAKNLLKALAYSVADRSAGLVIEWLNLVCGETFHDRFRALTDDVSGDGISSH
jgi:hypothetical protein